MTEGGIFGFGGGLDGLEEKRHVGAVGGANDTLHPTLHSLSLREHDEAGCSARLGPLCGPKRIRQSLRHGEERHSPVPLAGEERQPAKRGREARYESGIADGV